MDVPPSSGHQWGKCRRITMLVLTQKLETSPRSHSAQKCAWTVSSHLVLNTLTPRCITEQVSLTRRRVHTYIHPHTKPKGSPISSSPILLPLSIKGWWSAEKLKAHSIFPNGILSLPKKLRFLEKGLSLSVCEQRPVSMIGADRTVY